MGDNGKTAPKKLAAYRFPIITADYFRLEISRLRAKYDIPPTGYNIKTGRLGRIPKEWHSGSGRGRTEELFEDINTLLKNNGLPREYWVDSILGLLFYNELSPEDDRFKIVNLGALALLSKKFPPAEEWVKEDLLDLYNRRGFPVLVALSPYVSERDVVGFIKQTFRSIKPILKKVQDPSVDLGRRRGGNPKIARRNALIYRNRRLPFKQILEILKENGFEALDPGHITKIISMERKRNTGKT
jgi:hypothetical protein